MGRKKSLVVPSEDALPTAGPEQMAAMMKMISGATAEQVHEMLQKSNGASKLKSNYIDPFNLMDFMGSRAKPTRVTWQILRRMALSCKPVAAIIQTRQNQIAAFTQIPRRTGDIGFRITTKNPAKKPTAGDLERMHELTNWFLNMGYSQFDSHYEGDRRRDNFDNFIRKMVRDTLTLDAVCFEVQRSVRGKPYAVFPVDPATIKFAAEKYEFDPRTGKTEMVQPERTDGLPVRYVQELYNGVRVAVFNERDMVYGVRNPRTDSTIGGYGLSELEILMETVTQILFAEQYNAKYFTQNSLPQGVLNIAGKYTPEALESFKRQWLAQVTGVSNAWRIPIMAIDDSQGGVNFTAFKGNNREMQFNLWLEYLIQAACSVYTIDPGEIGFVIKGAGGGPMVEHSGAVKLDFSKDKGLRPILKFMASIFNESIVNEIYPDLFFEWVGIDAMSESQKIELATKKLNSGILTVNEARALEDLDEIKSNWADAPANSTLIQVYMADMTYQRQKADAAEQAASAPAGAPGMPGQPGAAPGGAPPPGGGAPPAGLSATNLNPSPKDNGVDLPLPAKAKKDKDSSDFQQARENEKQGGKALRDEKHLGLQKSIDEDDVIEIVIE